MTGQDRVNAAVSAMRKYYAAESISDDELKAAVSVLPSVREFLQRSDDRFRLCATELTSVLNVFEGFLRARKGT